MNKVFVFVVLVFLGQALGQSVVRPSLKFSPLERTIIRGVISQYKKECGYVSVINESKVSEIQNSFSTLDKKSNMSYVDCMDQYLGQMVGAHSIYKKLCDEVTTEKKKIKDIDLSRIFRTIKRFEGGIRPYHEKLNDCLVRNEAPKEVIRSYSDFEMNSKILSQKIREVDTAPPFRENRVDFR